MAQSAHKNLAALERAFNILARPELRACYDALLDDPAFPTLFPYGGFGSLLAAGDISHDGSTFYASRILSFLPEQEFKHFRAPLRKVAFYNDRAIYRDSRRKLEVLFDQTSLPLLWDSSWNPWKHLLGAKIGLKATFLLQSDLRLFRTGMKPGDSRKSKMCVDNKRHTSAHQPWPPTHQMGIQSLLLRHLTE